MVGSNLRCTISEMWSQQVPIQGWGYPNVSNNGLTFIMWKLWMIITHFNPFASINDCVSPIRIVTTYSEKRITFRKQILFIQIRSCELKLDLVLESCLLFSIDAKNTAVPCKASHFVLKLFGTVLERISCYQVTPCKAIDLFGNVLLRPTLLPTCIQHFPWDPNTGGRLREKIFPLRRVFFFHISQIFKPG